MDDHDNHASNPTRLAVHYHGVHGLYKSCSTTHQLLSLSSHSAALFTAPSHSITTSFTSSVYSTLSLNHYFIHQLCLQHPLTQSLLHSPALFTAPSHSITTSFTSSVYSTLSLNHYFIHQLCLQHPLTQSLLHSPALFTTPSPLTLSLLHSPILVRSCLVLLVLLIL